MYKIQESHFVIADSLFSWGKLVCDQEKDQQDEAYAMKNFWTASSLFLEKLNDFMKLERPMSKEEKKDLVNLLDALIKAREEQEN